MQKLIVTFSGISSISLKSSCLTDVQGKNSQHDEAREARKSRRPQERSIERGPVARVAGWSRTVSFRSQKISLFFGRETCARSPRGCYPR